jgi:ankyrin repeat protein
MRGRKPTLDGSIPSVLHIAAYAGLTEYAKYLIYNGQSVHSLYVEERTPLHLACKQNHVKMASLLLENGSGPIPKISVVPNLSMRLLGGTILPL